VETWCTVVQDKGDRGAAFGAWCLKGAAAGRDYGLGHMRDPAALARINDYAWLRQEFARVSA